MQTSTYLFFGAINLPLFFRGEIKHSLPVRGWQIKLILKQNSSKVVKHKSYLKQYICTSENGA